MTNNYPNLCVYISRDIVRYSRDILKKGVKYVVNFYVPLDLMNVDAGKKIESFVNKMEIKGLNFEIMPVPRCLFESNYCKCVEEKMADKPKKFFIDGSFFRFAFDEEIEEFEGKLVNYFKCMKCDFKKNKECKGLFLVLPNKTMSEKTTQWFLDEIQKRRHIRFLDLGCGEGPFTEQYAQSVRHNDSTFVCVDPSSLFISRMKTKIPDGTKIFPLLSTGESLPLKKNIFDMVLVNYSYSHFINANAAMENIRKILKKGGSMVIFEACHPSEKITNTRYMHADVHSRINQTEFRNHRLQDAIMLVKKHGFEIVDSFENKENKLISWGIMSRKR
jgi:ubiquinone/menaquinone biosynthesis C-methylase UbiE